ncbi:hypothetical protein BKA69DRAFT_83213 [Paraphysoderma sedebokerense]|nr:hypothetical protein BKA69DRAFT_83213 [Paraphysoderma sedebokerense]
MTVDPRHNKYIKYFKNIRKIQNYLCEGADACLIPKIDNTNVDRSLAIVHRTIFNVLIRQHLSLSRNTASSHLPKDTDTFKLSTPMWDPIKSQTPLLHEEYQNVFQNHWSSKRALDFIRAKQKSVTDENQLGISHLPPLTPATPTNGKNEHSVNGKGANSEKFKIPEYTRSPSLGYYDSSTVSQLRYTHASPTIDDIDDGSDIGSDDVDTQILVDDDDVDIMEEGELNDSDVENMDEELLKYASLGS